MNYGCVNLGSGVITAERWRDQGGTRKGPIFQEHWKYIRSARITLHRVKCMIHNHLTLNNVSYQHLFTLWRPVCVKLIFLHTEQDKNLTLSDGYPKIQ